MKQSIWMNRKGNKSKSGDLIRIFPRTVRARLASAAELEAYEEQKHKLKVTNLKAACHNYTLTHR